MVAAPGLTSLPGMVQMPAQAQPFQYRIVACLGLLMMAEGYDLKVGAYAIPWISRDLHLSPAEIGGILSASLFGMAAGSPLLGYCGDRFGRRPLVNLTALVLTISMFAVAWSDAFWEIWMWRALAGFAIGGLIVNSYALLTEFAPAGRVGLLLAILGAVGGLGALLPIAVADVLVPLWGWGVLFTVGAILSLLSLALVFSFVPESIQFLLLRRGRAEALASAQRLAGATANEWPIFLQPPAAVEPGKGRWRDLFANRLAASTLTLWASLVCGYLAIYMAATWIPQLLSTDADPGRGVAVSGMFVVGGVTGLLISGPLADRLGVRAIPVAFLIASPILAMMALLMESKWIYLAALLGALLAYIAISSLTIIANQLYPTSIRSRGAGAASGVGRLGAFSGPMIAAGIIGLNFPKSSIFVASGLIALTGFCFSFALFISLRQVKR